MNHYDEASYYMAVGLAKLGGSDTPPSTTVDGQIWKLPNGEIRVWINNGWQTLGKPTPMVAEYLNPYITNNGVKPTTPGGGGGGNDVPGRGLLELSFENGAVIVQLKTNKTVSVTKKGSIIIKDKKK